MKNLAILAYVLMIIGGALTISTAISVLFSGATVNYYGRIFPILSGNGNVTITFVLTMLPGLAVLYLGQRFAGDPKAETISALAVAAVSVISLFAVLNSVVYIYIGLIYSGPPISFAGGIAGALFNRIEIPLIERRES
jgi:hypothetical protein